MHSYGKCLCCIKVETGSLIFAIISASLNGLAILFALCMLVYVEIFWVAKISEPLLMDKLFGSKNAATMVFVGIVIIFSVPFTFSVVLLQGLVQKKPRYIRTYVIYGIFTIGAVVGGNCHAININNTCLVVLGCVIYGYILNMINMVYKNIKYGGVLQKSENKLIEEKIPIP